MQLKSAIMMRLLINRFYKGPIESFVKCLPKDYAKAVCDLELTSNNPTLLFSLPVNNLKAIHYSWFTPLIEKLPASIQPFFVSLLSNNLEVSSSKTLEHSSQSVTISSILSSSLVPSVKNFLIKELYYSIPRATNVLPKEYLPATELQELLTLNKQQLTLVASFLGLHDLAEELRHFVDQKRLKNVYACLDVKQQYYLKYCMHQKERVATKSLSLDQWDGSKQKLESTLQGRGLLRLAKSLSHEHPDFVWYLAHTLDRGRGQLLLKFYSKETEKSLTRLLIQQVLNLINMLKKKTIL